MVTSSWSGVRMRVDDLLRKGVTSCDQAAATPEAPWAAFPTAGELMFKPPGGLF